jgi:hypothetical protein
LSNHEWRSARNLLERIADHLFIQSFFAAEVIADHGDVGARLVGDEPGGDVVVLVGEKTFQRGLEQARVDRVLWGWGSFAHLLLLHLAIGSRLAPAKQSQ